MNIQVLKEAEKHIYHFTKSETALLYIFPKLRLKLTSYLDSNDPKENKTFGFGSIYEDCNEFKTNDMQSSFESYLKTNCKHLCFSSDYCDDYSGFWANGYNHPTMWAHYAGNSTGVCLAFNKACFFEENPGLLSDSVDYKSYFEFPKIDESLWSEDSSEYFKTFLMQNSKNMFFQKHNHWSVEHEFKVIELGNREYCSIEKSLKGVYLGEGFDLELIPLLKKLLPASIWIEKMNIHEGRFTSIPLDWLNISK